MPAHHHRLVLMTLAEYVAQQWALLREHGLIDDDRLGETEE